MLESVQIVGAVASFFSAIFWGLGAGIRIPPFRWWWWPISDDDPTTTALRRQSLMNAVAALFAAVSAICQTVVLYMVQRAPL